MSEDAFVAGEDGWAQCGGCNEVVPRTEQYGHFQSCTEAQNMAQVLKVLRAGHARVAREERAVQRERAKTQRAMERERERQRKREGRERE